MTAPGKDPAASRSGNDPPEKPDAAKPDAAIPETAKPETVKAETMNGQVMARLRRQRAQPLRYRFALFVLLPTLLATIYYGLIASDQYESHSVFKVHSAQARPTLGLEGLLGAVGQPANTDSMAVRDFILSRDMLALLHEENGFIDHFKDPEIDYFSRLEADASFEEAFEYYRKKVHVDFDTTSGSLMMRVRAFSPERTQAFAKAIAEYSEEMVNKLSERERNDQTRYAQAEVDKCEARLTEARQKLLEQQRKHAELNPLQTASAAMTVRTEMEGELAKARAELAAARSFMTPKAPRVIELQARVNALSGQVATEKNRLVDPKNEKGIAESMAQFEAVLIEKEFAQKSYESAMVALELARADAIRQHRYLAIIASPSIPDESTYPRRPIGVLTVFVLSILLIGIGSLLVAAVREHARI